MDYIKIPTFDPISVGGDVTTPMYPSAPPMRIQAVGPNEVKITIGDVSRVVDGVTLSNAVNGEMEKFRRRRRFR